MAVFRVERNKGYTVMSNQQKGECTMATTKNLCAQISLDLHQKISEGKEAAGLTTAQQMRSPQSIPITRMLWGLLFVSPEEGGVIASDKM